MSYTKYVPVGDGALFKNRSRNNENSPNLTGKIVINGEEYRVSAWTREPKNGGDKFLSLKISKEDTGAPPPSVPDDDVPF